MTRNFYLVRHTEWSNPEQLFRGRLPLPLSKEGEEHAQKIANFFADKKIEHIFSSAVLRCKQVAEKISGAIDVPIVYDRRLLEVMTAVQGMSLDQYEKLPERVYQFVNDLGGETRMDVQVRILDFFYEKTRELAGNSVIVSHGDPLYFLYLGLVGKELPTTMPDYDRAQYPGKGSVRQIVVEDGSLSVKELMKPYDDAKE